MQRITIIEIEGLSTFFDAVIEAEVLFDEDDSSVGYNGGLCIEGYKVKEYLVLTENGKVCKYMTPQQMKEVNPSSKRLVDARIKEWVVANEELIEDQAAYEAAEDEDSARESASEAAAELRAEDRLEWMAANRTV